MAKLFERPTDRGICAVPLEHAVYCQGCQIISNSRPISVASAAAIELYVSNRFSMPAPILRRKAQERSV
jgi:ATP sulfurylase